MTNTPNDRAAVFQKIREGLLLSNNAVSQRSRLGTALIILGSITTFEAMRELGIYDPKPRKHELIHEDGWDIETTWDTIEAEHGDTHRVGRYVLKSAPPSKLAQISMLF